MDTNYQTIRRPGRDELREAATAFGMAVTDEELDAVESFIEGTIQQYERIDELYAPSDESQYTDRRIIRSPDDEDDPHNAVVTFCEVAGGEDGPLTGYEIGLKDNYALAGVEMTSGSSVLTGYVPRRDATVVERLLDAGGTITAKLNMEDFSYSGSGELSAHGPVRNPRNPAYLAGGSSSGSAAAVASGLVDIAMGADQGGSVRMPASWCGVVGLKPTFGLVPYTGIVSLDPTIDYAGPITRTVEDCALALDVIAGADGLDPRQGAIRTGNYAESLDGDPSDLTVGVLEEGFDREESDDAVDETVRTALDSFEAAGADVRSVSVPMHDDGPAILTSIYMEGGAAMVQDEGVGHFSRGYYDDQFAVAFGHARRTNAGDFPPMFKFALMVGQYMSERYQGRYYARSQNLLRDLTAAYDEKLSDVDVLALPTTPHTSHQVTDEADLESLMERSLSMNNNTSPFNGSGHPAISVPCGSVEDDLPVGLMFVGNRFAEETVLNAAAAFERSVFSQEQL